MFIKIRTIDGKLEKSLEISKLMTIKDFKTQVASKFLTKVSAIQLYYRGKRLEDDYRICNYKLNYQDVVQLLIQAKNHEDSANITKNSSQNHILLNSNTLNSNGNVCNSCASESKDKQTSDLKEATSCLYQVGDPIDCIDETNGAWFEATVKNIFHSKNNSLIYRVQWTFLANDEFFDVHENMIRPRARSLITADNMKTGEKVMINYNIEEPYEDGYWYDFTIKKIRKNKSGEKLIGTLHVGNRANETMIKNCTVDPKNEIFKIEKPTDVSKNEISQKQRRVAITCTACMDDNHKLCKECGCNICSGKQDPRKIILCDECDKAYHISCLIPPLEEIPEDDWYCPKCKLEENLVIKAGEKLRPSKIEMKTKLKKGQKDWGRGMTCMGRVKECTIVPITHKGPVPGIEVGMSWKYRLQVSEAGVHRPHVAGIHGRESECAYSLVLSGGYEDDVDNGNEFIYTGSGGRNLAGNKRTAAQSSDQTLTKMNKALALNCNAEFNDIKGTSAINWREGFPVRVVRAAKMSKHKQEAKYAPEQGFRYDGIYKVVKYFPENGKSGFKIWRYLLRRDDPISAPWTPEGKLRIKTLGLKMIDYDLSNKASAKKNVNRKTEKKQQRINTVKRKREEIEGSKEIEERDIKRNKSAIYELEEELVELIKIDKLNDKLWKDCFSFLSKGKIVFIKNIVDRFTCVCCQEIVWKPTTTPCSHNICQTCLKRSFKASVYCCPSCRHSLEEIQLMEVNKPLASILEYLFPGYGSGRK